MTPNDIISTARYILNDTDAAGYRQSDAELLTYVNDGVYEVSVIRPDLFFALGDYTCVASQCEQDVTFADAQAIDRVISIHGGAAITPFDISAMDAFNPAWRSDAAGAAAQWSRHPGDLRRFYIYPAAPADPQVLDIRYVKVPAARLLNDNITELPAALRPALVDYVVSRASAKDDEHSNAGLTAAVYGAFVAKIKGV